MELNKNDLFNFVKKIIIQSRLKVYRTANAEVTESHWQMGKLIVEDDQQGKARAGYEKSTSKNLSQQFTIEFGKEFNKSNIKTFFKAFPIYDALRHEFRWVHYILLSRRANHRPSASYL